MILIEPDTEVLGFYAVREECIQLDISCLSVDSVQGLSVLGKFKSKFVSQLFLKFPSQSKFF